MSTPMFGPAQLFGDSYTWFEPFLPYPLSYVSISFIYFFQLEELRSGKERPILGDEYMCALLTRVAECVPVGDIAAAVKWAMAFGRGNAFGGVEKAY